METKKEVRLANIYFQNNLFIEGIRFDDIEYIDEYGGFEFSLKDSRVAFVRKIIRL